MAPRLKLVYFNIRGRGELIRLALHAGGVLFIDERIEFDDWPQRRHEAPNGMLPYIQIEKKTFGEVIPIVRFVAKKTGMMGRSEEEELYNDIILSQVHALRNEMARPKTDSLLNKGQQRHLEQKLKEEKIPSFLNRIEQGLTQSKTGFVLGGGIMTIADLAVWDTVDCLLNYEPELLAQYPQLQAHRQKIGAVPKLKKYLESRPESNM